MRHISLSASLSLTAILDNKNFEQKTLSKLWYAHRLEGETQNNFFGSEDAKMHGHKHHLAQRNSYWQGDRATKLTTEKEKSMTRLIFSQHDPISTYYISTRNTIRDCDTSGREENNWENITEIYKCWVTLQRWTRSNHLLPFPAETGSGWGNKEEEALEQTEDRSWAACTAAWPRWVSVLKNNPNKGYQPWWGPLEQAPNLCTLVWSAGLVGDRAPLWEVPSAVRKMDAFNQH